LASAWACCACAFLAGDVEGGFYGGVGGIFFDGDPGEAGLVAGVGDGEFFDVRGAEAEGSFGHAGGKCAVGVCLWVIV
jgi:hypothetical protein